MVRFLQVPHAVIENVKVFLDARSFLALVSCSLLAAAGEGCRIVDFMRRGSRRVRFRSLALDTGFDDGFFRGLRLERVFPVLEEWVQEFHNHGDIDACDACGLRVEVNDTLLCSVFDKSSAAHPPGSASQPKATLVCCEACAWVLQVFHGPDASTPMQLQGLDEMMVLSRSIVSPRRSFKPTMTIFLRGLQQQQQ